jgi:hypothetical protein
MFLSIGADHVHHIVRGGHGYLEQGKPLLSLACPNAASGPRRPCESHAGMRASEKRATGQVPGPSPARHRS